MLNSLQPRTGLKTEEPTELIFSTWFLFYSHLPDQECSSSYNHIRFRQSFTRLHFATAKRRFLWPKIIQHLDRASRQPPSQIRRCSRRQQDCPDAHTPRRFPKSF